MSPEGRKDSRRDFGDTGEFLAREYLGRQGYRIIAENFRTRLGEIDIIAENKGVLVFVEVKTRSSRLFGTPADAITMNKKRKISKLALEYISRNKLHDRPARFDVVAVQINGSGPPEIELFTDAFDLSYGF